MASNFAFPNPNLGLFRPNQACYILIFRNALLAQLAEQLTLNQRVVGSSPTRGIFSLACGRFRHFCKPVQLFFAAKPPFFCLALGLGW